MGHADALDIGSLVLGVALVVFGFALRVPLRRWHARRLSRRLTRESDAYADELRSLQAHKPDLPCLIMITVGAALIGSAVHSIFRS